MLSGKLYAMILWFNNERKLNTDLDRKLDNSYQYCNTIGDIYSDTINYMMSIIRENNDHSTFQNQICNGALSYYNYNRCDMSDMDKSNLRYVDYFTEVSKNAINNVCDLILEDKVHTSENKLLCIYFQLLLLPIYKRWKSNFSNYLSDINSLNKITEIELNPVIQFSIYCNQIKSNFFHKPNEKVQDLISFLEKIKISYDKYQPIEIILPKNIIINDKTMMDKEIRDEQSITKHNIRSNVNPTINIQPIININTSIKPTKSAKLTKSNKLTKSTKSSKNHIPPKKIKDNLNNLKVEGLRYLCQQYGIKTKTAMRRDDLINAILAYNKSLSQ